jgi:hypothetical protein
MNVILKAPEIRRGSTVSSPKGCLMRVEEVTEFAGSSQAYCSWIDSQGFEHRDYFRCDKLEHVEVALFARRARL